MEGPDFSRQDFTAQKIISPGDDNTEWKKPSPLKTYSKKTPTSEKSDNKSRYGRSHKPKLSGDFLSTDKKVSQYLKINADNQMHYFKASPYTVQKTSPKVLTPGAPRGRGRPPKSLSTPPKAQDGKYLALNDALNHVINLGSSDLQAPLPTSTETIDVPRLLMSPGDEEALSDSEEVINENDWNVGDLAWACIGGYPYWPCAVTKEPGQSIYRKLKLHGKSRLEREFIHVRFFGDRGRRSWIVASNVIPFHGLDAFQSLAEETCSTPSIKKKDPKTFKAFTILPSLRKIWQAAVSEAESLRESPRHERVQYFTTLFPLPTESPPPEKSPPKKRGRKSKAELAALAAAALSSPESKKIKTEPTTPVPIPQRPIPEFNLKAEPERNESQPTKPKTPEFKLHPRYRMTEYNIKREPLSPVKRLCRTPSPTPSPEKMIVDEKPPVVVPTPPTVTNPPLEPPVTPTTPLSEPVKKKRGRPKKVKPPEDDDEDFVPDKKKTPIGKKAARPKIKEKASMKDNNGIIDNSSRMKDNDSKKFKDPAYEQFYDKNFDRISNENPTLADEDIEKFINKMWKDLKDHKSTTTVFRSKVQEENDSGSDSNEGDSRSNSPPPISLPSSKTPFRRGLSLFSGVKGDKVCQVCLKNGESGEILKCRGPCGLSFHLECAEKPRFKIFVPDNQEPKVVIKKKRGRSKSMNSGETTLEVDSTVEEDSAVCKSEEPTVAQPPLLSPIGGTIKKGRGRPRKTLPLTPVVSDKPPKSEPSCIGPQKTNLNLPVRFWSEYPSLHKNDPAQNGNFAGFADDERIRLIRLVDLYKTKLGLQIADQSISSSEISLDLTFPDCQSDESSFLPNSDERKHKGSKFAKEENTKVLKGDDVESLNGTEIEEETNEAINKEIEDSHPSKINTSINSLENSTTISSPSRDEETVKSDNNKLLATLRGDSFDSESSNNNLIVDESSTDDRLIIEESQTSKDDMLVTSTIDKSHSDSALNHEGASIPNQNSTENSSTHHNSTKKCESLNEPDHNSLQVNDLPKATTLLKENLENLLSGVDDLHGKTNFVPSIACVTNGNSAKPETNGPSEELKIKEEPVTPSPLLELNLLPSIKKELEKSSDEQPDIVVKGEENPGRVLDAEAKSKWMCSVCTIGKLGPCFVCGEDDSLEKLKCDYCKKAYHNDCSKKWPQGQKSVTAKGRVTYHCPQHVCHTCVSDNPSSISARFMNDKLVRCVRCPATYHYGNYCIPAGSDVLSTSQMLCPRHYQPSKKGISHVSASWCMLCANGGELICCDLCPNSFHLKCLNLKETPQGSFSCEDCVTGRYPLYGEIVWVKLGTYRWWPARILFPQEIPYNISQLPHSSGEFAVEFFGSHDYYWVNRGRCFLYHEGDGCVQNASKNRTDQLFAKGVEESKIAFNKWTEERANREANARPSMKPPKYVKIVTNKVIGNVAKFIDPDKEAFAQTCDCDPSKPNPCGPDSDCINRMLSVECNPELCPAKEQCCNRNFELRCYPRLVPFKTETRGWGLKTLDVIPKGSFIIEYVGEVIDEEEYKKRLTIMQNNNDENFYFLTIDRERMIDAGPKGNVSRFMNHSCDPNCETQKWTVNGDTRVGLFALENIQAESELVFNYNLATIGDTKVECKCGSPSCSGYIGVKQKNKNLKGSSINEEKKTAIKKKRRKSKASKHTEDTCFTCGNGGELLLCDDSSCPKAYHLSCLGLTKHPPGGWVCPWHQCSVCSANKVQRCTLCINSYCAEHADGNISLHRTHGFLCFSHNFSDSGSEWSEERYPSDEEDPSKKPSQKKQKMVNGHIA